MLFPGEGRGPGRSWKLDPGLRRGTRQPMKRLAVYCGSAMGSDPAFAATAKALGEEMARRGIGLVYGGGRLGLMGAVADAVMSNGGEAYGVIPQALVDLEVAHSGLTELHLVNNMHERKAMKIGRASCRER